MTHLLALDDDTGRYDALRAMLGDRATLTIAACPACVREVLPTVNAVLLDYDLDSGEPCPRCLAPYATWRGPMHRQQSKGLYYVSALAAAGVPVVVVSASSRENVAALCAALAAASIPYTRISAAETDTERRWVGWLWTVRVL